MSRISHQHPHAPVGAASYHYVAELEPSEPPEQVNAIPEWETHGLHRAILAAESVLARLIFAALFLFGLALAGLMFAQVLLRYVFQSPFVGIEEIALLFGVWIYFLGMAYVTRQGEHIQGGILTLVIRDARSIQAIRIAVTAISIAAAAVLGWYAIQYSLFEIEKGRMSPFMRWPRWLWSSSLVAGFGGMILYLVLQFANQVIALRNPALLAARQGDPLQ
ncbi:TRAP transporter small permease [Mangrovicoccus sp. HB161399]|uniref:TRAP transporter small permease n=1 Tax=Mangrovicoccus sp. HB161399 TaxID=2720392 RepID=UPI001555C450|nr:TRAP transporter small permease [Mangrovicoccus sp. HB161399]